MKLRSTAIASALFLAVAALYIAGCTVDLSTPSNSLIAPDLIVRVTFTDHHADVDGDWDAELVSESPDIPESMRSLPNTIENVYLPTQDAYPGKEADFNRYVGIEPGTWIFTITVKEGDQTIISLEECRVDVPAVLGSEVFIVKVTEGLNNCTISSGASEPVIPRRDMAVLRLDAPDMNPDTPALDVEQGVQVSVGVEVQNLGEVDERFALSLVDTPSAGGSPGVVVPQLFNVTDLAPGTDAVSYTFQWNTAGASTGAHQLRASIPGLPFEEVTGNNSKEVTVSVYPALLHDVEVSGVTAVGPIVLGGSAIVRVDMKNNGDVEEAVTAYLDVVPPGGGTPVMIGPSPSILLAPAGTPGDTATYNFSWDTTGTTAGTHSLTARIPAVQGETVTANNRQSITAVVETHDVEAVSLSSPPTANIGDVVLATATVRNNSNVDESNVEVTLTAQPPGGGAPVRITQFLSLNAGASAAVGFNWDTHCIAPAGDYALSVTASVPNDSNPSNNTVSPAGPLALAIDHELSITITYAPPTLAQGTGGGIVIELVNNNSVAETGIDIDMTDTPLAGPTGAIQEDPRYPEPDNISLACGETLELFFLYFAPSTFSADHNLTVTIAAPAIPGDDPADNSDTVTVTVP